jgi:hypothetical protein
VEAVTTPDYDLLVSPTMTNGQIAAVRHVLASWIEGDATIALDDATHQRVTTAATAGDAFDPFTPGINTPGELFAARTLHWVIQALRALSEYREPTTKVLSRPRRSALARRRLPAPLLEWVDGSGAPIDTFEKREDADDGD